MHLELILEAPRQHHDGSASSWTLERGRKTLGRGADCDWQIKPADTSIAAVHCLIERQGDRFILENCSPHGASVEGAWLHDGQTAVLRDQSIVVIGNYTYRAAIHRERSEYHDDPRQNLALSSEPLTISSILSDVVPAGRIASGPLGPRELDDPLAFIQNPKPGAPSSRNVEIGWNGAPDPKKPSKLLPDNWWEEGEPETGLGHVLEHSAATRVSVGISRSVRQDEPAQSSTGITPNAVEPLFEPQLAANPSPRLDALVRQLEQALDQSFSTLKLSEHDGMVGLSFSDNHARELAGRLEAILSKQMRVNEALETLFSESARLFDPSIVEVRADAKQRPGFAFLQQATYWRFYSQQFEQGGKKLSTADLLRSSYLTSASDETGGEPSASKEGSIPDEV